ncbi:hypothetical protein LCGC14_0431130 [marine sediment metagenome]|uniref:Uncharacterized protein n=1 Tax=marine sediment metagenome TaxID=412755 RepID=A0A0F9VXJ7_9ZZZZ
MAEIEQPKEQEQPNPKEKPPSWWSYGSIYFTLAQVKWLLEHLNELREGRWPPEHKVSGYTGSPKRVIRKEGSFVRPAIIAAEMDVRLSKTGNDGLLLEARYNGTEDSELCSEFNLTQEDLDRRITKALKYITGEHRRWNDWTDKKGQFHRGQSYKGVV